jgi:hypothetical protein
VGGANLSLSPTSGPAGSTIGVNGSGFGAGEQINLAVDGGVVMAVNSDGNGNFATSLTLSASLALGDHVISATGMNSGHSAFASFTVTSGAQVTPCTDDGDSRPGNGFGDRNHCHTGPPGHGDRGDDNSGHDRGDRGNLGNGNDREADD